MKWFVMALALFFSSGILFAQGEKAALEKHLQDYIQLTTAKNHAAVIEYIHPAIFELAPKAMIVAAMDQIYNDPKMEITLDHFEVSGISDPLRHKKIQYALVQYVFDMHMFLTPLFFEDNDLSDEPVEGTGMGTAEFIHLSLSSRFGKENVQWNADAKTFHIRVDSEMFAILDPDIGDWKFIENRQQYADILKKIVPVKIQNKLLP